MIKMRIIAISMATAMTFMAGYSCHAQTTMPRYQIFDQQQSEELSSVQGGGITYDNWIGDTGSPYSNAGYSRMGYSWQEKAGEWQLGP